MRERVVGQYLDQICEYRWNERRGGIKWSVRLPDMAPWDCFLWTYLKNNVDSTKPNDMQEIRNRASSRSHRTNHDTKYYEQFLHSIRSLRSSNWISVWTFRKLGESQGDSPTTNTPKVRDKETHLTQSRSPSASWRRITVEKVQRLSLIRCNTAIKLF